MLREGGSPDQLTGDAAARSGISIISLVVTSRNRTTRPSFTLELSSLEAMSGFWRLG